MSATFNKTILIGRLREDPKINDKGICQFTVNNRKLDYDGNETEDNQSCFAKNKQSKIIMDYLSKGDLVCVEGKLHIDKSNPEDFKRTIEAERITFLTRRRKRHQSAAC